MLSALLVLSTATSKVTVSAEEHRFTRPEDMGPPREGLLRRPVVSGLPSPLLQKVQKQIRHEVAFHTDGSFAQSGAVGGDFDGVSTDGEVLCLTLRLDLMGAYPTSDYAHRVVDLRTGRLVTASAAFEKLKRLAALCEGARKSAVKDALDHAHPEDRETIQRQLHGTFRVKNLEAFKADNGGVTFYFDYDFIHAVKSLEPKGEFHFDWAQMAPFTRKKGPLRAFLKH